MLYAKIAGVALAVIVLDKMLGVSSKVVATTGIAPK